MGLLELIESLDARGIRIEVKPSFVRTAAEAPTRADVEAAQEHRVALIRVALARAAMEEVLALEKEWAGYPGRRTPELDERLRRARNAVLYLLPEDLPWEVVAKLRPDGTKVGPPTALALAS
jgi:hypothetical protein